MSSLSAALIIIGNEILSGRTQDANLNHLAKVLADRGLPLREARVIPDVESTIIATVNELRAQHTCVFTTGGIGPTHDDITTPCVAKAFGVPVVRNPEIVARFKAHYGERATDATFRMADFPHGATLIETDTTPAPGFCIGNVYVFAGIPRIMQAMLTSALPTLPQGLPIREISHTAHVSESRISAGLESIQNRYPQLDIGSYPFRKNDKPTVTLVAKGTDAAALEQAGAAIAQMLADLGAELTQP